MKWSMPNDNILLYLGFVFRSYQYDWYYINHVCTIKLMIDLITEFTYLELLTIAFVSSLVILWYGSKR